MAIRLISLDVDGTLVDDDGRAHPAVGSAIKEALARGIQVCLNSGRGMRELDATAARFGLTGPYVCSNGSLIHDGKQVLWGEFLDADTLRDFLRFCWKHGADMLFTAAEATYFCSPLPAARSFTVIEIVDRQAMKRMIDAGLGVFMMSLSADDPVRFDRIAALWEEHRENPGLEAAKTYRTILGITKKGVNKGSGMLRLAALLGVAPGEILAVGDNENDIEMLRLAGTGVAMGNAPGHVKEAADYVTGTVCEGGAAAAIRRHALGEVFSSR